MTVRNPVGRRVSPAVRNGLVAAVALLTTGVCCGGGGFVLGQGAVVAPAPSPSASAQALVSDESFATSPVPAAVTSSSPARATRSATLSPTVAKTGAAATVPGSAASRAPTPRRSATPRRTPPTSAAPEQPTEVYYANCTEAKAAGAAPIRRGEPGYRPPLDRDDDGIACET